MTDQERLERIAAATRRLDRLPARIRAGRELRGMRRMQDMRWKAADAVEPSLLAPIVFTVVALLTLAAGLGGTR